MVSLVPVAISFVCYSIFAFLIKVLVSPPENLKRKEQKDYLGQHLSIVHAYLAVISSFSVYCFEGGVDYNAKTNFWHELVISVNFNQNSFGYFIFDTIYAEIYKLHNNLMRFHHVFGLIYLITVLYSPIGGSAAMRNNHVVGIFIAEISNPCILKRHIIRARGQENSLFYNLYENSFIFLFISLRIIFGFWYILKVWDSQINWFYMSLCSSIYTVSWFWVFIIFAKAMKSLNTSKYAGLAKINAGIRYLKGQKALLLLIFLLFGYGVPYLLTQVLKVNLGELEVEGFQVV